MPWRSSNPCYTNQYVDFPMWLNMFWTIKLEGEAKYQLLMQRTTNPQEKVSCI
jgi:hypothetical protein